MQLTVDAEGMAATVQVAAGEHVTIDGLRALLTAQQIHHGLMPAALLEATRPAARDRQVVIARGQRVQQGSAGWIDLLIREPTSVYGDGTVDLHEQHHFRDIAAGTPIARIVPPTLGRPGIDVTGRRTEPAAGKSVEFGSLLGPGCRIDERDPHLAIAEVDGIYQRFTRGGRPYVQVTPQVTVPGDVDMTIGNISSQFPVVVQGDVHATFSLKSRREITVRGSVEDARVSARGDLAVLGGILQGRTRVKAHGDLSARHIESREVKARNIRIDFAIHMGHIRATGLVTAKEIIGGSVVAAAGVVCDTLGSPDGVPTLIHVGVDPFAAALTQWAHERGAHLGPTLLAARERCRGLAHRVHTLLSAGEDHAAEDHILRIALHELEDLQRLDQRCQEILAHHPDARSRDALLLASHARIEVRRRILPPVTLRIGNAELLIRDERPGGVFRWVDGRIVE